MARRLQRYLHFFHGAEVQLFDVNEYLGPNGDDHLFQDINSFFEADLDEGDSDDSSGSSRHKHITSGKFAIIYTTDTYATLSSMWGAHSKWHRRWITNRLLKEMQAHSIFIEIQVDDSTTHRQEYMEKLEKFRGMTPGELAHHITAYAQHFVTIQDDGTEDDLAYMKLMNYNHKVLTNNMMRTFIGSRIAQFLTSVHPYPRTIYLTRHGESEYNVEKKIGGDSSLSPLGRVYAERLGQFAELVVAKRAQDFAVATVKPGHGKWLDKRLVQQGARMFAKGEWPLQKQVLEGMRLGRVKCGCDGKFKDVPSTIEELKEMIGTGSAELIFLDGGPEAARALSGDSSQVACRLWTSSLKRTQETAEHIPHPKITMGDGKVWTQMSHRIYRNLDEVYAGEFEGLTYEEIKQREPVEASLRKFDKLGYRYPRGESYYDLIARLDNPMQQLETFQEPIIIIGHQAVHRLIYAFLAGIPREQATDIEIPLHTVIKISIDGTGKEQEQRFVLGPFNENENKFNDGQSKL